MKLGFEILSAGVLGAATSGLEMARRAEALGYDAVVVGDHVVLPRHIDSRPPSGDIGGGAFAPEADYLEPVSMLGFLAGATRRIRIGTSVLVLPYRNPVLTAKMLATVDTLSGGRLFVGVGAGWLAEEFEALAAPPFARRGEVADEWLEILLRLWTEDDPKVHGHFYTVAGVGCFPRPAQRPHPPILVGGNSRAAIRRAARYGQGWHPFRLRPVELVPRLRVLREELSAQGRLPETCGLSLRYGVRVTGAGGDSGRRPTEEPGRVFAGTAPQVVEQLKPIVDLAPSQLVFDCRTGSYPEVLETMERLADEVWPRLR
jgi:probable F420-dependent oxidoreductase